MKIFIYEQNGVRGKFAKEKIKWKGREEKGREIIFKDWRLLLQGQVHGVEPLHPGLHMKGSSNGKQSLIYLNNI